MTADGVHVAIIRLFFSSRGKFVSNYGVGGGMPVSLFSSCFRYSYVYNDIEDAKQCQAQALAHIRAPSLRLLLPSAWTSLGDSGGPPPANISNLQSRIPSLLACCTDWSVESWVIVALLCLWSHFGSSWRDNLFLFSPQSLKGGRMLDRGCWAISCPKIRSLSIIQKAFHKSKFFWGFLS